MKDIPYDCEILEVVEGNADYIYNKEKELHKIFKSKKIQPKKDFGGKTECFNININYKDEL